MRSVILCLFFYFSVLSIKAQEIKMSLDQTDADLTSVLNQIEKKFEIRFSYSDKYVSNEKITLKFRNKTLDEVLELLNESTTLNFEQVSGRNVIIQKINSKNITEISKTHLLKEVVLNEFLTEGIRKQRDGSYHFSPKEISILPGQAEPDIFQTLQLIPGVISPDETSTNIYVRGGTPDQNLILWNGIKIYQTGHLYGSFSVFNPHIIKDITFINKGTDAKYGDRISGVIDIKTNDEITEKFSGGFGFNLIDFDGYLLVPVVKDKLSVEISGRRSLTDFLVTDMYNKYSEKVFQNQNTDNIFKGKDDFYYLDYSLKINGKINERNYFSFSFINVENDLKTKLTDGEDVVYNDELLTTNQGYNLNWKKYWSSDFHLQANIYYSKYNLKFSHNERFESDDDDDEYKHVAINNTNNVKDLGLSLNFEYKIKKDRILNFGYQASNYNIEYLLEKSAGTYDFLNNQSDLSSHSVYGSYQYKNRKLFDITGGIRLTYYSGINNFELEPRINFFKSITQDLSFQASLERKTQAISQINRTINQNLTLEDQIWSIANNKEIPLSVSWQYTVGFIYSKNDWHFEIDAYFKEIGGITTLNNGFIDIKDLKIQEGESKIMGSDLYIRKRINQFITSVSYTLSSAKNNFEEINEDQDFPMNSDIRHNLNWSNEYSFRNFKFALGWRWHSGKPYSKAIGIEEDDSGNKHMIYDGINSYRLPSYSRFDFSGTYSFNIIKAKRIKAQTGISVLNIFNNENLLNRNYTLNQKNEVINTIDTQSIQRVFNVVFRVTW